MLKNLDAMAKYVYLHVCVPLTVAILCILHTIIANTDNNWQFQSDYLSLRFYAYWIGAMSDKPEEEPVNGLDKICKVKDIKI